MRRIGQRDDHLEILRFLACGCLLRRRNSARADNRVDEAAAAFRRVLALDPKSGTQRWNVALYLVVTMAPFAATVIQLAISRTREYDADEDGEHVGKLVDVYVAKDDAQTSWFRPHLDESLRLTDGLEIDKSLRKDLAPTDRDRSPLFEAAVRVPAQIFAHTRKVASCRSSSAGTTANTQARRHEHRRATARGHAVTAVLVGRDVTIRNSILVDSADAAAEVRELLAALRELEVPCALVTMSWPTQSRR